jgi:uncharacterized membrane protein YheB (UPF0754 family)
VNEALVPSLGFFGRNMEYLSLHTASLASVPLMGAFTGWITTWIAIKMIFRPRQPINIFGLKIVGFVPRRQRELAERLGETIERDLVSHRDVQQVLQSPEIEHEIGVAIESQVDVMFERCLEKIPMASMLIRGELALQLKRLISDQMRASVPEVLDSLIEKVEHRLDFKDIIRERVEQFDMTKLEHIIYSIAAKEIRMIELLTGALGFVVGFAQLGIMIFVR